VACRKLPKILLFVSASGDYDWRDRMPSKRTQENAILPDKIKTIFDEEHKRAGAKRMAKRLDLESIKVGRYCIAYH
jgi:putative transposase